MRKYILSAFRILDDIYANNRFSDEALKAYNPDEMTTKLVYGVLENDVRIEYILSCLSDRKPQKAVFILLKIGVYALIALTNVPKYAIVSECVEAAKRIGKGGASGYINAVLKRVSMGDYPEISEGDERFLSVKYSVPKWFADRLESEYGREVAERIMGGERDMREHIRVNSRIATLDEVRTALVQAGEKPEESKVGGLKIKMSDTLRKLFLEGKVTFMSPSSMLAGIALSPSARDNILDLCSAPGGKAVYMSELARGVSVTACELYPHRIKQLEGYIKRMLAVNVTAMQWDATALNEKWIEGFDCVLVDAPCSCLGTYFRHPDVFLNRKEGDIAEIAATQRRILANAARYVKRGGKLLYSTCTLLHEENSEVVATLDGFEHIKIDVSELIDDPTACAYDEYGVQIFPQGVYDGFYLSLMKKK